MKNKYDVFEVNEILIKAHFDHLMPEEYSHDSLFYCISNSIWILIKEILRVIVKAPMGLKFAGVNYFGKYYNKSIFFLLPSLNNLRSLKNVIKFLEERKDNIQVIDNGFNYDTFPLLRISVVSFSHLMTFWRGFSKLGKTDRRVVCYYLYNYVHTCGVLWFYKKMVKKYRPQIVILANDHTFFIKALELVCEDNNIPCLYVQHASVSYAFPELHFSHSFLDGTDALNKYTCEGKMSKGTIILLGASRYDELSKYRVERSNNLRDVIGIAINELDDNVTVDALCEELLNRFPSKRIKIRSHPAMKNNPFTFTNKERIDYTCATDESMIDYLDSIDIQISNDSGVHLDAILGGVRTIAYNLSKGAYGDNYEYVKSGLIHLVTHEDDLKRFIEDENFLPIDITKVRQFDESYGKSYAGHCSDVIAQFILSGLNMEYLEKKYSFKKYTNDSVSYYMSGK